MSLIKDVDENYIKLAQIYQILKKADSSSKHCHIRGVLENNFDINYKLPIDSFICYSKPQYAGNTALHFLAEFHHTCCQSCLNIFIDYDADFTIINNSGFSPLLLAFDKNDKVYDLLLIHIKTKNFKNVKSKNGISHFHVACATGSIEVINFFLKDGTFVNDRVNDDSPKYPGYTPLHFAMQYEQYQTIELLLNNGANVNIKDAKGMTPLQLLNKSNIFYHRELLLKMHTNFLLDRVGLTNLHISCLSYDDSLITKCFSNQDIDFPIKFDSPVWPGYSPLHIATHFNFQAVIFLLEKGADLLAKDANGTSPWDLCLKRFNINKIIQILSVEKRYRLSELKLTDGTFLLDVLKALSDLDELIKFMDQVINVNIFLPFNSPIFPGYNLLHLSVMFDKFSSYLLSYNVDFTTLNAKGSSPLHLAFNLENKVAIIDILDLHEKIPADCVDEDNNLSHLHIACIMEHEKSVNILLKNGSNPNLQILKDIECNFKNKHKPDIIKSGSTPFLISVTWIDEDLTNLFLSRGADINAADADGKTPFEAFFDVYYYSLDVYKHRTVEDILYWMLQPEMRAVITTAMCYKILSGVERYFLSLKNKVLLKMFIDKLIEEKKYKELGLTRLHVACAMNDYETVSNELDAGTDINQSISFDSHIWPGDTALHIALRKKEFFDNNIVHLLIIYGADITLKNAENLSPFHLLDWDWQKCASSYSKKLKLNDALSFLSRSQLISGNSLNNDGLSLFHLCCKTSDFLVIEEFLKSGVDVNAEIDHFAERNAGYSPLHLAIEYGSKKLVDLLLEYGADFDRKATNGLTPLCLLLKLRSPTTDDVKTIIDKLPFATPPYYLHPTVNLLLNKNAHMDLAHVIFEKIDSPKIVAGMCILPISVFSQLINSFSNSTEVDVEGQNLIHLFSILKERNSLDYFKKFNELIKNGYEINHKDRKGKTPLHLVVCLQDEQRIKHLLSQGADFSIKDDDGKMPFAYASEINKNLINFYVRKPSGMSSRIFNNNLKKENLPFSSDYFFSEEFVKDYRKMSALQRKAICNICGSINLEKDFPDSYNLINEQYRKARVRMRMFDPAAERIQFLSGFFLPLLCIELIFDYLNNDDLMNLIRSENGKLEFAPLPEDC